MGHSTGQDQKAQLGTGWATALLLLGAAQAVLCGLTLNGLHERTQRLAELLPHHTDPSMSAQRVLPALLEHVPDDARVLIVTREPHPLPWAFHLLPRRWRALQALDDALLTAPATASLHWPRIVSDWYERLEREDRRLTPERFEAGLAWADWVIMYGDGIPWPAETPRLRLVATVEGSRLVRIVR